MGRFLSIILINILILVGIVVSTTAWVDLFYQAILAYRSPLSGAVLSPQIDTPAQTDKIVVVIISGLGYDNSFVVDMPTLAGLRQIGANAAILSTPPTFSQTSWATLISGAPPELNDAPPFDLPVSILYAPNVDTIFNRVRQANHQTALLGHSSWQRLVPQNQLDNTFFVDVQGPQADELILENSLTFIKDSDIELVVVHLTQLNFAASEQGGLGGIAYQQATAVIDAHLAQILATLDLTNTVLMVLSEHGHLGGGGHGGAEIEVIWQPLVMVGENVIPGDYSDINQSDIAPTITALLGVPPPTAAQGRILYEMLRFNELDQAQTQMVLAQQRIALADYYNQQINGVVPNDAPTTDPFDRALAAIENNNISGAIELATFAQVDADTRLQIARNQSITREQLQRIPVALIIVGLWALIMWRQRDAHTVSILISALITIGLYHALYQLQGYTYSISIFTDLSILPLEIARRITASVFTGGGVLFILLLLSNESRWLPTLSTLYTYSLLIAFSFLLPFFWGYWQNGLVPTTHLPEVNSLFWQIMGALESGFTAVLGLLLPWPITVLILFIQRLRFPNRTIQSRPKSDALRSGMGL